MNITYNFALEKATRERDNFLKEHPEYFPLQRHITKSFEETGDTPEGNMEIIVNMMEMLSKRLLKETKELNDVFKN